jgi:integrase
MPTTPPHTLRRTYISIALLANNFDVLWVMHQVGRSDSKMTLDVYAWGVFTRSQAAVASYSWMRPPSRSRRRGAMADPVGRPLAEGVKRGSGDRRSSAR